ncbi:Aspartate aminotransferase [Candidatus Calditenuaceae archaeon HR02]|nr:Aspartate aminotransferase [Candidatus Calditenuaceae archaeon HR02]
MQHGDGDDSWVIKYFDNIGNAGNMINLGIGEPDFDMFEPLKEEAERVIRRGLNKYTMTAGIVELREAIAGAYSRRWGVDIDPDNVVVTPGASSALFMSLASIIRPGDWVVIPTPSFPSFKALTQILGGRVVEVEPLPESDFQLDVGGVKSTLGEKGVAVILNSPTNPTGTVIDERAFSEVVELCRERGTYLISDEVYERFVYGVEYTSAAKYWGEYDRIVVINSFSKTLAMTGWRLGYMIAPPHLKTRVIRLQAYINACAPSVAQYVALYALKSSEVDKMINEKVSEYWRRRDVLHRELNSHGVSAHLPRGGIYLFPRIPLPLDSETFCNRLAKEAGVVTIPGKAFGKGGEGHFRITLSASPEKLVEAAERIAAFVERARSK